MSSIIELAISEPKHLPWISDWVAELSRLRRQTRISGAAAESSDPSSSKRFQISPAEAMASLKLASFRDIVTSIQERYAGWEGVKAIGLWDDTCKVYFKSQEAYSQFNPFNKTYQYELDNNLISFTLTRWYEDAAYFKIINCDVMKKGWIADFGKSKSEWARENNITIQRVFIVRSEMYWVVPLQAAPRLLKDVNVALGGHLGTAM
ncbi:hypothetical protein K4K59_009202 [Colletotrichum sp. SAR11_240]|nr:hypothetical protein K4K59_009202 [Colletotrichum sp. SAR11_240]